jgi:hypothetical protein
MFAYTIDMIAEDCYDLYVSDDDGYTWEYYSSYECENAAREDAEAAKEMSND